MKVKYWYLQHVPIVGILFVIYIGFTYMRNDITWSNVFYKKVTYFGNMFDWVMSTLIQGSSVCYILYNLKIYL
jgi:hypothetical protein